MAAQATGQRQLRNVTPDPFNVLRDRRLCAHPIRRLYAV